MIQQYRSVYHKLCRAAALACAFATAVQAGAAMAEKPVAPEADQEKVTFLRTKTDDQGEPLSLQTAVARYVAADGKALVTIDLIGAVHVGEKSYYEELNQRFKQYEALLYEIVAPEGTRIPKGGVPGGSGHPVSALQTGMKDMLGLEHQLEIVDYTVDNFVHADMTPEEFAEDMQKRDDGFLHMFGRVMGQALVQQSRAKGSHETKMLAAMMSKDREVRLKQVFADQIKDMDAQMRAIEGSKGSTIISQRNAKAFKVLRRELDNGKTKLGVFYGAGHLADMHRRLVDEFGMKLDSVEWVDAWDLTQ
jgi:hypothetical protein